ncbi:MAG: sulfatase [Phycisphaerae bacterium]|jgi:arylsulfatase A-like enzyme
MRTTRFITQRMWVGGALLGLYGLWVCARLPAGLPPGTRMLSWAWAVGLFAGAGMMLTGVAAGLAMAAGTALASRRFPPVAATIEILLLAPFAVWLILNEATYQITSEVLGYETVSMIRANPAATFEAVWEMGGRYVWMVSAVLLAGVVLAWRSSRCSYGRWRATEAASAPPVRGERRLWRVAVIGLSGRWKPPRCAGPVAGTYLAVLAGLFAWQFHSRPSAALTAVCRSAPPLRALNLTRALLGDELRARLGSDPAPGAPLISDEDYRDVLDGPRRPAPNVVVIVLESVPAKALHCYGHPRADVTPNLDRLAAEGTLFEHCWATASFSSYGLVSAMTSLYMLRAEYNDHFADTSFPFMGLPRALKLAGYQLALFSSGNEAFDNINRFYPPADFDVYFSLDVADVPKPDCMRISDHYAVERFEQWLSRRRDPRPFYCGFYLQSTHFNYEIPEPWASYYQPVPPLYSNGSGILQIPPEVLPLLKNQYDNAMRYSDYWVGRIRSALERAGAFDNAIVVVFGDHGEAFMEHGLARHGVALWEEMIHVPLIVHAGSAARQSLGRVLPSRVAGTVSCVDIAPTVAGLVGIRPHPSWQGLDVLDPEYTGRDRPVFSVLQLTKWQEAVILDGFKYIYDLNNVSADLYDLRNDPDEQVNLIQEEPALAGALKDILSAWHTRQLNYYARRHYSAYLGRFEPSAEALELVRQAATEIRNN